MMTSSHALSLHLKMCKLVVEASVEENTSWGDLYKLLPQLRHALACTVCGDIVEDPTSPSDRQCQHSVCKACIGGKKRLKPSCSYCKDYQAYIPNKQLQLIVEAFRKTCQYLQQTEIYTRLNSFCLNGGKSSLIELIQEGANCEEPSDWAVKGDGDSARDVPAVKSEIVDSEHSSNEGVSYHANIHISSQVSASHITSPPVIHSPPGSQSQSCPSPEVHFAETPAMPHASPPVQPPTASSASSTPVSHPFYPMFFSSDGGRVGKLEAAPTEHTKYHRHPVPASFNPAIDHIGSRIRPVGGVGGINGSVRYAPRRRMQKGCRCGNATPTPGKLTCCGQRCPCYVESRACVGCRCRGCRNPHRPGGKKVRPCIPNQESIQIPDVLSARLQPSVVLEATQNSQSPQPQQQQQQHVQQHHLLPKHQQQLQQQQQQQQHQQPHQQQQQHHQQQQPHHHQNHQHQQNHQSQQNHQHQHGAHHQQHHQQQPSQQQQQPQQPVFQPVRIDSPHHTPGALPPVHHVIHMQHPVFQTPMFINTVPVATLGSSVFMTDSTQNGDSIQA